MSEPVESRRPAAANRPPEAALEPSRNSLDTSAASASSSSLVKEIRIREEGLKTYTIDLLLPPEDRYNEICADFTEELHEFSKLYTDVLKLTGYPRTTGFLARVLLKKVHSKEETKEIKGIARASGLKLHEAFAYNSFLDLFSGCVSGGVKVDDGRMLHFRGLDWDMDSLRDLLIQVEYVREGRVVARGVTYAGYVGVLTGVRQGLSIAMNFRIRFSSSSHVLSHRKHQLSMLLGSRPSIASQLRALLLSPGPPPTLDKIREYFAETPASPCYLTFCSNDEVLVLEKDLKGFASEPQRSKDFLAVTNHDLSMESWSKDRWIGVLKKLGIHTESGLHNARGIMDDSMERKACVLNLWRQRKLGPERVGDGVAEGEGNDVTRGALGVEEIQEWLRMRPVRNETTHFSCIMDPSQEGGGLLWVEACEES